MRRLKAPQRKKQLIAVATRIFARHGYEATTTHAIAEAAGITEPILYRHFKSKQDLFVAIVRQMSSETVTHWKQLATTAGNPIEQIRVIAREFPQHLRRLTDAYHVIHGALVTSRDRRVLAVMKEHYGQIEGFFSSIIRRGQEMGLFRRDLNPRAPAWHIIQIGIGYAMISLNLSHFDHVPVADAIEAIMGGIKL
jgi:AcrR family transcriptional regulator